MRAGTIAAATYNVYRDSKKRPQPFSYVDVFPHLALPQDENPQAEAAAIDLFFTGVVADYRKQHPGTEIGGRKKISRSEMVEAELIDG